MGLKVLHLWNMTAGRCGIKNFGQMFSTALRNAGCQVDDWDITYPAMKARGDRGEPDYMPANVGEYDVVHFGWHPITNNCHLSYHFADVVGVRSVYLHDIPPWSGCPCLEVFQVRMTSEPSPISTLEIPYPIVDWVDPKTLPPPNPEFTVGISGVREDGFHLVQEICERRGWELNVGEKGTWLSIEDEIRRLARSTVNVCWYHEQRGLSGTPGMMLGARRPLLINDSAMLRHMRGAVGVFHPSDLALEYALISFEVGWKARELWRYQQPIDPKRSWSTAAKQIITAWEAAR